MNTENSATYDLAAAAASLEAGATRLRSAIDAHHTAQMSTTNQLDLSTLHRGIAGRIKTLRKLRGWSAQKLGEEMTLIGVTWDRSIVANFENGRRSYVTVEELLALGRVLRVPPLALLGLPGGEVASVPSRRAQETEVYPDGCVRVIDGRREMWTAADAPGGWICAEVDPAGPAAICGRPVESEPCDIHHPEATDDQEPAVAADNGSDEWRAIIQGIDADVSEEFREDALSWACEAYSLGKQRGAETPAPEMVRVRRDEGNTGPLMWRHTCGAIDSWSQHSWPGEESEASPTKSPYGWCRRCKIRNFAWAPVYIPIEPLQ